MVSGAHEYSGYAVIDAAPTATNAETGKKPHPFYAHWGCDACTSTQQLPQICSPQLAL
jgi:hypothetical protein